MARQKGIIRLKGNLDGLSFYRMEGKDVVRKAYGPNREQIRKDARFVRTRENNTEFSAASHLAKTFRMVFAGAIHLAGGGRLNSQLIKIFKAVNLMAETGARGQRPFALSAHKGLLNGFELNTGLSFQKIFRAGYRQVASSDRHESTVVFDSFDPEVWIDAPVGASHFMLVHCLGALSDLVFDGETGCYVAVSSGVERGCQLMYGPLLSMQGETGNLGLEASLPAGDVPGTGVSVVHALGIVFYQRVGSVDHVLEAGRCMGVVAVF